MRFMTCNTCKRLVQINPTGICLGCQRAFQESPQEDSYEEFLKQEEKKEGENAVSKSSSESLPICQQAKNGKRVAKRNPKRKKTAEKSKKEVQEKIDAKNNSEQVLEKKNKG